MTRLILLLLMISAVVIAVTSIASLFQTAPPARPTTTKDTHMPASVKNIAYVLLIVLMFGVVSGAIGGL